MLANRTMIVTQHQVLRGHIPCIIVGTTRAYQECGQIWENLAIQFITYSSRWLGCGGETAFI